MSTTPYRLPPGPRFDFWQPLAYARAPHRFLRRMHARYGDPFTLYTNARTVMTAHPEGARQVFTAPADTYHVVMPSGLRRVLGAGDLRSLGGAPHLRTRRLVSPCFHGESLKGIGEMVHDTTARFLAGWRPGEVRDMWDTMHEITLDVILQTVFGVDQPERLPTFRAAVQDMVAAFGSLAFLFSVPLGLEHDNWPPNRRLDQARERLAALLRENIDERRATGTGRPDLLCRLMEARFDDGSGFTDTGLVDALLTNLIAGRGGSALLLGWFFAWLGRHPEINARVQQEIDSLGRDDDIAAIQALPYLDAVLKECLRLHPQVPEVVRALDKPMELRGYLLPKGTHVAVCTAVLHMDPDIYPEPERFRPERFLERQYNGFEFTPFGGGHKLCVGNQFVILQVKTMLAVLLSRGRFTSLDRGPVKVVRRGLLIGPDSVRVRFEPK